MRLPKWLHRWLTRWAVNVVNSRDADVVIEGGYLYRWHIIPPNPILSLYVHVIRTPDPGRAIHDHRSCNLSVILEGMYLEYAPNLKHPGSKEFFFEWASLDHPLWCSAQTPGLVQFRRGSQPHQIVHVDGPVLTLFVTGPTYRKWGFWDPRDGWVHWREYLDPNGKYMSRDSEVHRDLLVDMFATGHIKVADEVSFRRFPEDVQ